MEWPLQFGATQRVPELMTSQLMTKRNQLEEKEKKGKIVGWCTKEMNEKVSNPSDKDTEG